MCADHVLQNQQVAEERPDLLNARGASADANEPANIVWTNRGSTSSDSDGFNSRFGAAAETARAVVDAVIVAYERMIGSFNYATAGATYSLEVSMNGAGSGFGASASLLSQLGGKPKSGRINMGAGSGSTPNGTGNGWFLDPTPYESSEFQGNIVNAFAGDAQSGSPAAGKGDFYTVFAAELTHCIGLFGNAAPGWAALTTATTVSDTAEGGGIGQFWIFDGPSIKHLLSSNNGGSGGQNFNAAIHSAGPITTTINGTTYVGAQDQGNAVYEFGRRYLVNNTFALMFKDAYGYGSVDPALYGTMYSSINQTSRQLTVRGGTGTSADNVSITRVGNTLRVSVDVGADVAGTGALPGAGNLPAFVTEYDISTVGSILIGSGDGNDTITLGNDLGVNVSVSGGSGTDGVILQGDSGDNTFAFAGTTASVGTTNLVSIIGTESFEFLGGDGSDVLTLTGSASAETFNLNTNAFSGSRSGTFGSIETIALNTLGGADTVNVNAPSAAVLVDVGISGDVINVNETVADRLVSLLSSASGAANTIVNVNDGAGSASFAVPVSLSIQSLNVSAGGSVTGAGDLTLTGTSTWSGGEMTGSGKTIVAASGTLVASTSATKLTSRTLNNEGSVRVEGGNLHLYGGGVHSGLFSLQGGNLGLDGTQSFAGEVKAELAGGSLSVQGGASVFNAPVGVGTPTEGFLSYSGTSTFNAGLSATLLDLRGGVVNLAADSTFGAGASVIRDGTLTGNGAISFNGTIDWEGGAIAGNGSVVLNAGATLLTTGSTVKTLGRKLDAVNGITTVSSGTLSFAPGLTAAGRTPLLGTLNVLPGAILDLNDNSAVVDYTGSSPAAAIGALLTSGYAGGAWNGVGINSSAAASTTGRTLGFGEASELFEAFPATFAGASVDSTSLVIRYTAPGDANLDGNVNFDDLLRTAQSYGSVGKSFAQGNFNYDATGNVDFDDLLLLAQFYGTSAVATAPASTLETRTTTRSRLR